MTEHAAYITLDKKGRATLPEEVREALGVAEGDFVLLEKTARGTYELVPASLIPRDQLWFYHPEMQERIARAERDIREGRGTRTRSIAEAQRFLASIKPRAHSKRPKS
jgi:AbrB family looped-hinge helix DNA binding protein